MVKNSKKWIEKTVTAKFVKSKFVVVYVIIVIGVFLYNRVQIPRFQVDRAWIGEFPSCPHDMDGQPCAAWWGDVVLTATAENTILASLSNWNHRLLNPQTSTETGINSNHSTMNQWMSFDKFIELRTILSVGSKVLNKSAACRRCGLMTPYKSVSTLAPAPDNTKPWLPKPMLTYHQWGQVTMTRAQFHQRYHSRQLLK